MQNGLGIVLAGGLGGYVILQRQGKEKLEEELSSKISSEQQNVQSLKDEVSRVDNPSSPLHVTFCLVRVLPVVKFSSQKDCTVS